jgi:hypothetical protein
VLSSLHARNQVGLSWCVGRSHGSHGSHGHCLVHGVGGGSSDCGLGRVGQVIIFAERGSRDFLCEAGRDKLQPPECIVLRVLPFASLFYSALPTPSPVCLIASGGPPLATTTRSSCRFWFLVHLVASFFLLVTTVPPYSLLIAFRKSYQLHIIICFSRVLPCLRDVRWPCWSA